MAGRGRLPRRLECLHALLVLVNVEIVHHNDVTWSQLLGHVRLKDIDGRSRVDGDHIADPVYRNRTYHTDGLPMTTDHGTRGNLPDWCPSVSRR